MKKDLLKILEIDPLNYGKVIKLENEIYILMDNMVHSLPNKVPCFKLEKKQFKILENFLIYYQKEEAQDITWHFKDSVTGDQLWAIKIKVPKKFITTQGKVFIKDVKISLGYDEVTNLNYLLLKTDTYFYKVFDFQESEYEIFHDIDYTSCFLDIQGDQYMTKTGLTLRSFYELKKKAARKGKKRKTLLLKLKEERSFAYDYIPHIYKVNYEEILSKSKTKHRLLEKLMKTKYHYPLDSLKFDAAHELVGGFDLIEKRDYKTLYKFALDKFNYLDLTMYPAHLFYVRGLFIITRYLSEKLGISFEFAVDYLGVVCRLNKKINMNLSTEKELQLEYETFLKEEASLIL